MIREIKFRAYPKRWLNPEMLEVTSIFPRKKAVMCSCCRLKFDDIELMQSTGLKDKNGVEIYEGDIVQRKLYDRNDGKLYYVALYYIIFEKCGFRYKGVYEYFINEYGRRYREKNISDHNFWIGDNIAIKTEQIEVIGNIYENPELLKECEE